MDCPIPLTVDLIPRDRKNRPAILMAPRYVTVHDTGNEGATAAGHAEYLKSDEAANAPVSWHFTVDDKGAYQHLPLNETGWHAADGRGDGNMTSIGVEICEVADRAQAETNAVKLIAWLTLKYGMQIGRVVPHRRWYPKDCPHLLLPRWSTFLRRVDVWRYAYEPAKWDGDKEIALLREKGIVDSAHGTHDKVTWGEFATVLNRLNAHE